MIMITDGVKRFFINPDENKLISLIKSEDFTLK